MRYFHDLNPTLSVSGPASEPVSLAEAKAHCRIEHDYDDSLITTLISAARVTLEEATQRACTTTTVPETCTLKLDAFPAGEIELRKPPIIGVTSVAYLDSTGASQTWGSSNYIVVSGAEPGRIARAYGVSWPTTYPVACAVTVTFTAGYSTLDPRIRQAILMLVGHWYQNREIAGMASELRSVPMAFEALAMQLQWGDYR